MEKLYRLVVVLVIALGIAAPAAAHNKIAPFAPALDLRGETVAQERVQPLPIFAGTKAFDEVAHVELPAPSIADELARRGDVESPSHLAIFDRTVNRKLALGLLGVFDENNVNEQSELGRELRRTIGNVRERWLDPQTGSFLSPDPKGYVDSANLYAFAGGDPVNRRDPTGESYWEDRVDELNGWLIRLYRAHGTADGVNVGDFILIESSIKAEIERLNRQRPWFAPRERTTPAFLQGAANLLEKWESAPGRARQLGQRLWANNAPVESPDVRALKESVGASTENAGDRLGHTVGDVTGAILSGAVTIGQFTIEGEIGGKLLDEAVAAVRRVTGRWGNAATRQQAAEIAAELKARGWDVQYGGGEWSRFGREEYLPPVGGGRFGGSYPDITATKNGRTLRINTVDTYADGVTLTKREGRNAARIRTQQKPGDHLVTIPKPRK